MQVGQNEAAVPSVGFQTYISCQGLPFYPICPVLSQLKALTVKTITKKKQNKTKPLLLQSPMSANLRDAIVKKKKKKSKQAH